MPSVHSSLTPDPVRPAQTPPTQPEKTSVLHLDLSDPASGAAWSIISYILSGILFWGFLGWLLDRWMFDSADTRLFVPIGVLVGTAAGGYLGYMRFLQQTSPDTRATTGDGRTASTSEEHT